MKKTYNKPITTLMAININYVMTGMSKDETPADPTQDGLGKSRGDYSNSPNGMNALW